MNRTSRARISHMHVLDNPVWHALTGPHATVAEGNPLAARYDPEVSVFAALPDEILVESWDALRELIGPGGAAVFPRPIEPPAGWTVHVIAPCRQMWLVGAIAPDDRPEARGDR